MSRDTADKDWTRIQNLEEENTALRARVRAMEIALRGLRDLHDTDNFCRCRACEVCRTALAADKDTK